MQPVGILLLAAAVACTESNLGYRCSLQEGKANLSSVHLHATWAISLAWICAKQMLELLPGKGLPTHWSCDLICRRSLSDGLETAVTV